MFIGRKEELAKLSSFYASPSMGYGLIYGRGRIGKSEIIKESLKHFKGKKIYYICKETSERNNIESLCQQISLTFNIPVPLFSSMEETLLSLCKLSLR